MIETLLLCASVFDEKTRCKNKCGPLVGVKLVYKKSFAQSLFRISTICTSILVVSKKYAYKTGAEYGGVGSKALQAGHGSVVGDENPVLNFVSWATMTMCAASMGTARLNVFKRLIMGRMITAGSVFLFRTIRCRCSSRRA